MDDEGTRSLVVRGDHGTLYLHEDGTYRLSAGCGRHRPVRAGCLHPYTVQDGFRGTDAGTITINLDNANTAPVLLRRSVRLHRRQYRQVRGAAWCGKKASFAWNDMEGDAIASVSIGGVAYPAGPPAR